MSYRSSENLNRMGSVAGNAYNESSSYPITGLKGLGLDISNNDSAVILIFTVSGTNKDGAFTNTYRVPAGGTLNELFSPFSELDVTQSTSSFDIIVKESV